MHLLSIHSEPIHRIASESVSIKRVAVTERSEVVEASFKPTQRGSINEK